MFYETRVLDAYGNLKKTISSQELQARHWKQFQLSEENLAFYPKKDSSKPRRKKEERGKGLMVTHLKKAS
jgi:hypothetical protein